MNKSKRFWCNKCKRKMVSTTYIKDSIYCYYCGVRIYELKRTYKKCKRCNVNISILNKSLLCRRCFAHNYWRKVAKKRLQHRKTPENSKKVIAKSNLELFQDQEMKGGAT